MSELICLRKIWLLRPNCRLTRGAALYCLWPRSRHERGTPMSFHTIEQAPARLNRSELAVPGSQPQLFEKAAKSAADVVFLDLEDAVAPDDKEQARKNV